MEIRLPSESQKLWSPSSENLSCFLLTAKSHLISGTIIFSASSGSLAWRGAPLM